MTDRARWKYVPESPTEAMLHAFCCGSDDYIINSPVSDDSVEAREREESERLSAAYKAMLAAAPSPPAMSGEAEETVARLRAEADEAETNWEGDKFQRLQFERKRQAAALIERQAREIAELKRAMRAMHEDENDRAPGGGPP